MITRRIVERSVNHQPCRIADCPQSWRWCASLHPGIQPGTMGHQAPKALLSFASAHKWAALQHPISRPETHRGRVNRQMSLIPLRPHTFRQPPQQDGPWQEVTIVPTSRVAVTQSIVLVIGVLWVETNVPEGANRTHSADCAGGKLRSDRNRFLLPMRRFAGWRKCQNHSGRGSHYKNVPKPTGDAALPVLDNSDLTSHLQRVSDTAERRKKKGKRLTMGGSLWTIVRCSSCAQLQQRGA